MDIQRLTAFTTDPAGGNPAGVVLLDEHPDDATMLAVAADVGYSETAFLVPAGPRRHRVRYFAPQTEVSFCGHATIAAGVALAERDGAGRFVVELADGTEVPVDTAATGHGMRATLTSPSPRTEPLTAQDRDAILDIIGWTADDLDDTLPAAVGWAGAAHPILVAGTRERLADLDYDFDRMRDLMTRRGWTTVDLVWRESDTDWHARNLFAVGGVVEDPATGAAAAAFGGWLRHHGLVRPPTTVTVQQGVDMGRPSTLTVEIPAGEAGILVSGYAVRSPV